ncbi:MAG TPA: Uma2 family endonuclease [Gemmataceae bacterium]|jgi:Uma2 family endonuclease
MSILHRAAPKTSQAEKLPMLEPGDNLDQKTFHARYEAMPEDVRAELIEGVVYMPSPLKYPHGRGHSRVMIWLGLYQAATPGTEVVDNATTILGEESEPQPDGSLYILPEYGGQMREDADEYLVGAPELIVEVASSSEAIDLHGKRRDYEKAGVREYVVVVLRQKRIVWFVRRGAGFTEMEPGADGIYRSELFGGLWLDGTALFRADTAAVQQVLQLGLASPDHARFKAELASRRQPKS